MDKKKLYFFLITLILLGVFDAAYLTIKHYQNTVAPCSVSIFFDCGKVLQSKFSEIFGIPLAVLGLIQYTTLAVLVFSTIKLDKRVVKYFIVVQTFIGFLFSIYLVYTQLFAIKSICLYCMLSALISTFVFVLIQILFVKERKRLSTLITRFFYKNAIKKILFQIDSEIVHNSMVFLGSYLGKSFFAKSATSYLYKHNVPQLSQNLVGIQFANPIGLAAGFDYEAQLAQFLPSLGFGFATAGTITNMAYAGNPKPRLGRLPNSKSLMVNKGFKSSGAKNVSERLKGLDFEIPVGISIGRTNSPKLKTQKDSVKDIITAFTTFEKAKIKNSYYELNISCPNLIHGNTTFYSPKNLKQLLVEVDKLKLKKPVFVKMPIEKNDKQTLKMLETIAKHSPSGVIFGNLQKDKKHPLLNQKEVKKFKAGFFSGKPTYNRSNELIKLAYKNYKDRFVIIGCGGVFNAEDTYEKITLGASLVQLITGLIYEGPQLVSQINFELDDILSKNGFKNISSATGVAC